ncbi:OCIA domain-containing protein 2 [Pitangus sulphuratus]|nr:OCIA domain-containing protein 2 [Pitangus sulphuratus]
MFFCPISQIQDAGEIARIRKECKQESFWYRGIFSASPRFGPYPKMAIAGILGFAIGKMSYFGECQKKFEKIGMTPFGPQQKRCGEDDKDLTDQLLSRHFSVEKK